MRYLLAATFVCALGCGSSEREHASCRIDYSGTCTDYSEDGHDYLDARAKDCKALEGVWSATSCPIANRVGSCTVHGGDGRWDEVEYRYAPKHTVDSAKEKCVPGTFAPVK